MDSSTALVPVNSAMPSLTMAQAKTRRDEMVGFVRTIMVKGTDYGEVPGTTKPTLLKPGAEKLATFFGLRPTFSEVRVVEDWTGKDNGGRPFFYYWFRCHLLKDEQIIAEGDGSCNSLESKYRYRQGERTCPNCGKATIIKGKAEYGGGWLCFAKKGGCGAKFGDTDPAITGQQVGRIENPDPADQVNTLLKMAQKRALVAAVLIGVNASEFFTQDVEDMASDYVDAEYRVVEPPTRSNADAEFNAMPSAREERKTNGNGKPSAPPPAQADKPKMARIVGNPGFPQFALPFAQEHPKYATPQGGFDAAHIQARAALLGYEEINSNNIGQVFAALKQYAAEQQALPIE